MNQIYKKYCTTLAILTDGEGMTDYILECLHDNGIKYSKSRVHGWGVTPSNKNYRHMTTDEMLDVMDSVIKNLKSQDDH